MYFGIPPKIIKKLNLVQGQYLLVDVIDDIIVIKKMNQQFSKAEVKKIQTNTTIVTDKEDGNDNDTNVDKKSSAETNNQSNNYNPLRDVF